MHYTYGGTDYVLDAGQSQDLSTNANSTMYAKALDGMQAGERPANLQLSNPSRYIGDYSTTDPNDYYNEYNFFYLRNRFSISYNTGNGPAISTQTNIPYGLPISGYDPQWTGDTTYTADDGVVYSFAGWYEDEAYQTPFNFGITMPNGNLTLFAMWQPALFTVTFDLGDGTTTQQTDIPGGGHVQSYTPVRDGYTFIGWYHDQALTSAFTYSEQVYSDMTLYAMWRAGYTGYTVRYLLDGPGGAPVPGLSERTVAGLVVNSTVTETARNLTGYFPDAASKSVTLGPDASQNIIEFYYSVPTSVGYTVRYLDAATGDPLLPDKLGTATGARVVESYVAIEGYTPQRYQISAWLTMDEATNVLTFYYDENPLVAYTVQHMIQIGLMEDQSIIYRQYGETETKYGPVGSMATAEPLIIETYVFMGGNTPRVLRPEGGVHMVLYYDQGYLLTFFAAPGGSLSGRTFFSGIIDGTKWTDIPVPTPVANAGYFFLGWNTEFPSEIHQSHTFIAEFYPKTEITIQANSASKPYDGTPLTDPGYTFNEEALAPGHTLTAVVLGTITDVGTADNVVDGWQVLDADGVDQTANYTYQTVDGVLTITPGNIPLEVTAASTRKVYDGTPLTDPDSTWVADRVIPGMTVEVTVAGSITDVGSTANLVDTVVVRDAQGTDITQNFILTLNPGTLTVLPLPSEIFLIANSDEKVYDGTPLTNGGITYDPTLLVRGHVVQAVVQGSITNVGSVSNVITSYDIVDANGISRLVDYVVSTEPGTLTVTPASLPLAITAETDQKVYDGTPLTNAGFVFDPAALLPGHTLTATVTGTITNVGVAPNVVTAWQVTDAEGTDVSQNYAATTADGTLTVTAADLPLTITAATDEKVYDGAPLTNTGYAFDAAELMPGHTLTATVEGTITNIGSTPNMISGWAVLDSQGADVTVNYAVTAVAGTLTITPAAIPLTITAATDEKVYDGTPLTNATYAYSQGPLFAGHTLTATVSGSVTLPGAAANTVTAWAVHDAQGTDVSANYRATLVPGTLTVTPGSYPLAVTAASDSKTYDGTPLVNDGFTFDPAELMPGDSLEATVEGSILYVGTVPNRVTAYRVVNSESEDVTENYVVVTTDGTLEIRQAQYAMTIYAYNAEKVYDGTPLTESDYSYPVNLLASDNYLTAVVEGSITNVGEAPNKVVSYAIVDGQGVDVSENYVVRVMEGRLKITPASFPLTITAASDSKAYDGTPLVNPGFTYDPDVLPVDGTLEATVTGAITDPGAAPNQVTAYQVLDPEGVDITANFVVTVVDGTLTVTQASLPLVITAASDEKTYDGTPLTNAGFAYDEAQLAFGNTLEATVEGSITLPGSAQNLMTGYRVLDANGQDRTDNYVVTTVEGTLTVTRASQPLTVTAATDEKVYDGTPLTNAGYTFDPAQLLTGNTLTATVEGAITNVGSTANTVTGWAVHDAQGTDVTDNYQVTPVPGTLTVTPGSYPLAVTAASDSKTYDGTPLVNDGFTFDPAELMPGDSLEATVEGSILYVGTAPNRVTAYRVVNSEDEDVTENYVVQAVDGSLEITPASFPLTITAASGSKAYDGTPLVNPDYTYDPEVLPADGALEATVTGAITDPGTAPNQVTAYRVLDPEGVDITVNFVVTVVDGTLTVTRASLPLVITAASDEKTYDGTPLTNANFAYDEAQLAFGNTLEATVEGSITLPGSAQNLVTGLMDSFS